MNSAIRHPGRRCQSVQCVAKPEDHDAVGKVRKCQPIDLIFRDEDARCGQDQRSEVYIGNCDVRKPLDRETTIENPESNGRGLRTQPIALFERARNTLSGESAARVVQQSFQQFIQQWLARFDEFCVDIWDVELA